MGKAKVLRQEWTCFKENNRKVLTQLTLATSSLVICQIGLHSCHLTWNHYWSGHQWSAWPVAPFVLIVLNLDVTTALLSSPSSLVGGLPEAPSCLSLCFSQCQGPGCLLSLWTCSLCTCLLGYHRPASWAPRLPGWSDPHPQRHLM